MNVSPRKLTFSVQNLPNEIKFVVILIIHKPNIIRLDYPHYHMDLVSNRRFFEPVSSLASFLSHFICPVSSLYMLSRFNIAVQNSKEFI